MRTTDSAAIGGGGQPDAPPHPEGGWSAGPDPYSMSRWSGGLLTLLFVTIVLAAGLSFIPLPYVVLQPGPIVNTLGDLDGQPIVQVEGAETYPAKGELDFTTVAIVGAPGVKVDIFDLAEAALREDYEILRREDYYPETLTREEIQQENTEMMVDSQEVAAAIALRETGHVVPERILVSRVPEGSPAEGVLEAGDEFVSVNGKAARSALDVQTAVRAQKAGEPVPMVVRRNGVEKAVSVPTRDNQGTTIVGVILGRDYELPVDVTITAGEVGGPSAGAMFTLAVYDVLTPGDLTGGKQIAGTGTIEPDESVGPIGGVRQKLHGAREGGADFFLAPVDNCDEVVGHVPDGLTVVKIGSFTDALGAVRAIAADDADSLPGCG